MSATDVLQRRDEWLRLLGPAVSRMQAATPGAASLSAEQSGAVKYLAQAARVLGGGEGLADRNWDLSTRPNHWRMSLKS